MQIRRCSPFLESVFLSSGGVAASHEWKTVPDIWKSSAEKFGDRVAVVDPYHDPPSTMTYKQPGPSIGHQITAQEGLGSPLGCPDQRIGIMATGAINVVRGSRSSDEELLQIYNHSDSIALVVDNPELFNRIAETLSSQAAMRFVILVWGDKSCFTTEVPEGLPVYNYKDMIDLGHESRQHDIYEAIDSDDVATILYTSGTTGNPKGVMLTHKNLLHQEDLRRYHPNYLVSVPVILEILYNGIQKQISTSSTARKLVAILLINISLAYMDIKRIYEAAISGGGSLPSHVDRFFEVLGSVGHPIRCTEIRVVDFETGDVLPPGSKGIVEIKGPLVMKGYYKNESATKQVLNEGGWLNTGDIGWIAPSHSVGRSRHCSGMVVLEGRAKDTIVLSTGENVEPSELEEAAMRSTLIQQIVVIGQDQRRLGAIIVPNKDEILATAKMSIIGADTSELSKENMTALLNEELRKWYNFLSSFR
ncbi:hypothetical protein C3L33_17542, partial [Rhododendron williamsianum]